MKKGKQHEETPNTNVSKQKPSQAYQPASSNTNGILYACGDMSGKGISVRYDDSSKEDNPVMLVRTVDSKGKETETKINPREINPSKASAAEMAALIAYSRDKGEAQPLNPTMIRIIHDTDNLLEKKDLAGAVKTYANNSINRQRVRFFTLLPFIAQNLPCQCFIRLCSLAVRIVSEYAFTLCAYLCRAYQKWYVVAEDI